MPHENLDDEALAALAASRPAQDMAIARDASEVVTHMIGDQRSVFDSSAMIWTADVANDLRARIEDNPIEGSDLDLWTKLDHQLTGATREVVLLAAELVFLRDQPLFDAVPRTRQAHVERVLAHLDDPVVIPESMTQALARPSKLGGFRGGQGYNAGLWKQLPWVCRFVIVWNGHSEADREIARGDAWAMQRVMLQVEDDQADIRNALQFLVRPDVFEPISSVKMKMQIRAGLVDRITGSQGTDPISIDRDLYAIRSDLAREVDGPFHFWTPGVRERWDPAEQSEGAAASNDAAEPRPRHYWLYSPGEGASMWPEFSEGAFMAIGWDSLGDLSAYPSRDAIRHVLDADGSGGSNRNATLAVWQFQNEMEVGDIVFAKRGRRQLVGRGEVTSHARFDPERKTFRNLRSVNWTHIDVRSHPGDAATKTLTDITAYRDYVEKLETLFLDDDQETETLAPPVALPPYDKDAFLREVYLSEERYDRLQALLMRKKNVILAGPPGVGKTFAAKRLAYSLMGAKDPSRVEMVQFHQSYSYEDFMMGYRPTETGGFVLSEGPFYRFCEDASADDANRPHFFVIDEINRGNISKIFGELLMLIEADKRGQELRLLYKNETFTVPANVHIIGMMNTADRSLAVLDYALRRRFGFVSMVPEFTSAGFTRWQQVVDSPSLDRLVAVVIELNTAIAEDPALGRGFAIGHSFLMPSADSETDDAWLFSVVEDELVPLLEEYWFDEPDTAEGWATRLRAALV